MRIFVLFLCLAFLQAVHSGLFPGNHNGKVDEEDLHMLHSSKGDHEMETGGGGHHHEGAFCGEKEQSPINIMTTPVKEIGDEHELEPPEAAPEEPAAGQLVTGVRRRRAMLAAGGKKKREAGKEGIPLGIKTPMELTFTGYNQMRQFDIELTHGGVQASFQDATLTVRGSAVPPFTYTLQQFHFHWGTTSVEGSEHFLDNQKYSMEMHMVHLSHKFKDVHAALSQPEGNVDRHALLVLGILIQAKPDAPPNPEFDHIVQSIAMANHTKATSHHTDPNVSVFNIFNLIPKGAGGMAKVVTYDGSLTTHNCNEVVSWFVFTEPLVISEAQIAPFRGLYDDGGVHIAAEGNARGVLPHNERNMYIKQVEIKINSE